MVTQSSVGGGGGGCGGCGGCGVSAGLAIRIYANISNPARKHSKSNMPF